MDLDRAWRLELGGTAPKGNIQFHYGKDASWSTGCIVIGNKLAQCPAKGPCVLPDSQIFSALRGLLNYVEATVT